MAVTIRSLSILKGDKECFISDGSTPEERDEIATQVDSLRKNGFALFLIIDEETSDRILDYKKDTHEWVLAGERKKSPKKHVAAADTNVEAIPQTSGG